MPGPHRGRIRVGGVADYLPGRLGCVSGSVSSVPVLAFTRPTTTATRAVCKQASLRRPRRPGAEAAEASACDAQRSALVIPFVRPQHFTVNSNLL